MKYIGIWDGWRRSGVGCLSVYIDDNDVFHAESVRHCDTWSDRVGFKKRFGQEFFGDERYFIGVDYDVFTRLILSCDGKQMSDVQEIFAGWDERREKHRTRDAEQKKRWEALRDRFGGSVIGIDKDVDVYDTGFSIRVLFNSGMTFAERKAFLKEHQRDFLRWVMMEVGGSKKVSWEIGDIKFYRPVEMICLRVPEVEVKFEIKEGVA